MQNQEITDVAGNNIVVIRGGGDIGTGVAHKLYRSGFSVIILERENPLVIRRKVAFAQAVFDGQTVVEDVTAVKAGNSEKIFSIWQHGNVPVIVDPSCSVLNKIEAQVVVDATLAKKNTGMHRNLAPITIALGPGFKAGSDVDVVIETNRGHNLGKIILDGYAEPNTAVPSAVEGYTKERVLRAPCAGKVRNLKDIGAEVTKGEIVGHVAEEPFTAAIGGLLRGIIMDGLKVVKGQKIGDIDPRAVKEHCFTISDKARAIGGGVLEAILYMKKQHKTDHH